MHNGKTKFMANSGDARVFVDGNEIEKVEMYKYLGQEIRLKNQTEEEVNARVRGACFQKYRDVFIEKRIIAIKAKIFNHCILPTMTYGCQTWNWTNKIRDKLRTAQHSMERRMLGISLLQNVNHSKISQATNVTDVVVFANRL